MIRRHPDLIGAAVIAVIGVATIEQGVTTPDPGFGVVRPSLLPTAIGVLMVASAAWLARDVIAGAAAPEVAILEHQPLALTALALLAYFALFVPAGFVLASVAFLVVQARILGSRSLVRDVVASVLTVSVLYAVFVYFLTVQLPKGPLPG